MRNTKTYFLILVLFIGLDFQNCSDDLGCPSGEVLPFFDIKGMISSHRGTFDSNAIVPIKEGDEIDFENYSYLLVNFEVDYITQIKKPSPWEKIAFSTMPKAYGCSIPANGYEGSKSEGLADLQFITLYDYSENYMVGDTINDILQISTLYDFGVNEGVTAFIDRNEENIQNDFFQVRPIEKPSLSNKLKYKIIVELTNGERYEHETTEVTFKE